MCVRIEFSLKTASRSIKSYSGQMTPKITPVSVFKHLELFFFSKFSKSLVN